jgi:hypothetical protein
MQGRCSEAFATATSLISPNATVIHFNPQIPICAAGNLSNFTENLQQIELSYTLNNEVAGRIEFWGGVDRTTTQGYDPNQLTDNIPSDCALLDNMTAYDVYVLCQRGPAPPPMPMCTGCTALPVQYEKANGRTLVTAVNNEEWQVFVWTPVPNTVNPTTNRSIYCLTSQIIISYIPVPLAATFSQVQRTSPNCLTNANGCFYVTINIIVDGVYNALYSAAVVFLSNPTLVPYLGNALPNQYLVTLGQNYNITLYVPGILCMTHITYQPSTTGPLITTIRTREAYCNVNVGTGTVSIYVLYNIPTTNPAIPGTLAAVCFYWPGRRGAAFAAQDEVPIQFFIPIDIASPTLLPYQAAFGIDNQFTGIVGGVQQLMIYDRCKVGVNAGQCGCKNPLPGNFQLLESGLNFAYVEFSTSSFTNNEGGLLIQVNSYTPANCYGDNYVWNYTIVDDAGPSGLGFSPYSILLLEPETGFILFSTGGCVVTNTTHPLPPPTPYGPFQVIVATFTITLPTINRGIGPSGNYTLVVRSCNTGCVQTHATFIQYVTPILPTLSSAGTSCASKPAVLVTQVIGGSPCQEGDPCYQEITPPGSNITYFQTYRYFWKTPTNPVVYSEFFMVPGDQMAGFYQLKVCDRNMCCAFANTTVATLPPIVVHSITSAGVCQNSNNVTVTFNVSGGDGTYFILQAATSVQSGQIIDAQFVASYAQTIVFNVMDGTGCINPENITFRLPDPGPVPISAVVTRSCPNINSGAITVTSTEAISCTWQSSGVVIPNFQSCTLSNIAPGAFILVTATNLNGCTGQQGFNMSAEPAIVIYPVTRSTNGELNGACIDTINFQASGGSSGPPFVFSLFQNPTPNTTVSTVSTFNGTQYGIVENVCRSYEYYIEARELSSSGCSVIYTSTDPDFNQGFSPGGMIGLPYPPDASFQMCIPPPVVQIQRMSWPMFWTLFAMLIFVCFFFVYFIFLG